MKVMASQQNLSVRGKSHSNGFLDLWNKLAYIPWRRLDADNDDALGVVP